MLTAERASIFAALGDATRLSLLTRLNDGQDHPINRLTATAPLSRQAVTKHLHVLEQAGLVQSRRAGRETLYRLRPGTLSAARDYLIEISRQWDAALGRLRDFVER
ncbi:MAG TPA: metalloregulator ArsR/SmtB family transcription factor [Acidocella sp.]|jgi:DNA-binding transcriptional ArsR family regulator|nr:metalloregulator ArsR/SmtB family transcription factor [Acidocella sp.]